MQLKKVDVVICGGGWTGLAIAKELATRIDDARPTVVVSASCGIEPTRVIEYKPMLQFIFSPNFLAVAFKSIVNLSSDVVA